MGVLDDLKSAVNDTASAVDGAGEESVKLLRDPKGYIFGAVALWVVKNVFVQPSLYFIALVEEAGVKIQDTIGTMESSLKSGVEPAASGLSGAWDSVIAGLSAPLVDAGLGAPLAASVTTVIVIAVVVTLVVLLGRIVLDVIPGGGAFL